MSALVGKVVTFKFIGSCVKMIDKKLNDVNAGKVTMQHDDLPRQNNWVGKGIEKVEASIPIKKNKTYSCIKKTQFRRMLS